MGVADPRTSLNKHEAMAVRAFRVECPKEGEPDAGKGTSERISGWDQSQYMSQQKEECKGMNVVVCVVVRGDMVWKSDVCGP